MADRDDSRGARARHGGPAKGPGWGGPANGPGCGIVRLWGPAKGAGNGNPVHRFQPGPRPAKAPPRTGPSRAARRSAQAEEVMSYLEAIAMDPSADGMTRVLAVESLLNRIEGKPVARSITVEVSPLAALSDEELEERRVAAERALLETEC